MDLKTLVFLVILSLSYGSADNNTSNVSPIENSPAVVSSSAAPDAITGIIDLSSSLPTVGSSAASVATSSAQANSASTESPAINPPVSFSTGLPAITTALPWYKRLFDDITHFWNHIFHINPKKEAERIFNLAKEETLRIAKALNDVTLRLNVTGNVTDDLRNLVADSIEANRNIAENLIKPWESLAKDDKQNVSQDAEGVFQFVKGANERLAQSLQNIQKSLHVTGNIPKDANDLWNAVRKENEQLLSDVKEWLKIYPIE